MERTGGEDAKWGEWFSASEEARTWISGDEGGGGEGSATGRIGVGTGVASFSSSSSGAFSLAAGFR